MYIKNILKILYFTTFETLLQALYIIYMPHSLFVYYEHNYMYYAKKI